MHAPLSLRVFLALVCSLRALFFSFSHDGRRPLFLSCPGNVLCHLDCDATSLISQRQLTASRERSRTGELRNVQSRFPDQEFHVRRGGTIYRYSGFCVRVKLSVYNRRMCAAYIHADSHAIVVSISNTFNVSGQYLSLSLSGGPQALPRLVFSGSRGSK